MNHALPLCAVWASADNVFVVVDVSLVFFDNAFYSEWIFIIDVDIVSRSQRQLMLFLLLLMLILCM